MSEAAKIRALRRGPGFWGFFIAHHFAGDLDHCYQVWLGNRPLWICSRCLGLYPMLVAVLIVQFRLSLQTGWYDIPWLFVVPLPSLVDWGLARLGLWGGTNPTRTLIGALLGVSVARTVYLNFLDPGDQLVMIQLACFIIIVAGVELVIRLRPSGGSGANGTCLKERGTEEQAAEERGFEQ